MDTNFLKIHSPYPPVDCATRLTLAMDKEPTWPNLLPSTDQTRPVIGRVTGSSVQLRKRINYRNSFQVYLKAEIHPEGVGSVLVGTFAMHPFVKAFMGCWFVGVFCAGGVLRLASLASLAGSYPVSTNPHDTPWVGVAVPPLLVLFGIALLWLTRHLARGDKRFITEFLVQTLFAKA